MAEYTKVIAFQVKDQQIQAATKRLFSSLERIEKKLGEINKRPAFRGITSDANRATKSVKELNKEILAAGEATKKARTFTRQLSEGLKNLNMTHAKARVNIALASGALVLLGKAAWGVAGYMEKLDGILRNVAFGSWHPLAKIADFTTNVFVINKAAAIALAAKYSLLIGAVGGATAAYVLFGKSIGKVGKLLIDALKGTRKLGAEVKKFVTQVKAPTEPTIFDKILTAKGGGLVGIRRLLDEVTTAQGKLMSTNSGYISQVMQVREVESALNTELAERTKILDRIITSQQKWTPGGIGTAIDQAGKSGGLAGLKSLLTEAEGIQGRMLSTQEGYAEQTDRVRQIQEAINKEMKLRKKHLADIAKMEEKANTTFGQRVGKFTKGALERPNWEWRGAGVGAAAGIGKGIIDQDKFMHSGFAKALGFASEKTNWLAKSLEGLYKVLGMSPEWTAIAAAAFMALGTDAFVIPERAAAGLIRTLIRVERSTAEVAHPVRRLANIFSVLPINKLNAELNVTVNTVRQMAVEIDRLNSMGFVKNKKVYGGSINARIRQTRRDMGGSGFAGWSENADRMSSSAISSSGGRFAYQGGMVIPEKAVGGLSGLGVDMFPSPTGPRAASYRGPIGPIPAMADKIDPVSKAVARHLRKIEKHTAKTAGIQAAIEKRDSLRKGYVPPAVPGLTGFTAAQYGPQTAPLTFKQRVGRQFTEKGGAFYQSGGAMGRAKTAGSSAMIGGFFPLLFGQGGMSAIGGGIGGALGGGLLGGGFGFGASVLGTVIGTKIQEAKDFRAAIEDLNKAIVATGGTSTFSARQVTQFAKSLDLTKEEALNALRAFKQFEASTRIALTTVFGSESVFNMVAGFKDNAFMIGQIKTLSQETSLEQAKTVTEVLKTKGLREAEVKALELIIEKQREITKENMKQKSVGFWDGLNPFRGMIEFGGKRKDGRIGAMSMEELREARGEKFVEKDFSQRLEEALKAREAQKELNDQLERMSIIKAPEDELLKLLDPLRQLDTLATSISDSFSESFKAIIKGTMTAQEALGNLFRSTANMFLDMAAKILQAQIRAQILGMFSGGLTPKKTTSSFVPQGGWSNFGSVDFGGKKAGGGPVSGGQSYLVGEKGPELFVPRSHGNIVPNNAMGGTNIVVNVDASGSSAEADGDEQRQLGNLVGAAIQAELVRQQRPGGLLH